MDESEFLKLLNRFPPTEASETGTRSTKLRRWELNPRHNRDAQGDLMLSGYSLMPPVDWKDWRGPRGERQEAYLVMEPGDTMAVYTFSAEQAKAWRKRYKNKHKLSKWRIEKAPRGSSLFVPADFFPADMGSDLTITHVMKGKDSIKFKIAGAAGAGAARNTNNTGIGQN